MSKEKWKDIKGYEKIYQVSSTGRVRRISYLDIQNKIKYKNKNKMLKFLNVNGYYRVVLSKQGINKNYFVHRLVAETFISNIDNKFFINHKDGNFIKQWDCVRDILKELKIDNCSIYNCCKNKRKSAGGYVWKYVK